MKEYHILKEVSLIVYATADMAAAKRFFREFAGADPYVDSEQYVGYKTGETEVGLTPYGVVPGALPYWDVEDIAARVEALVAAGGIVAQPITDVGYGLQVAAVQGPNGATVGLRQMPKR
jgi:predicted enzyme related to lactoylglutathione lyase